MDLGIKERLLSVSPQVHAIVLVARLSLSQDDDRFVCIREQKSKPWLHYKRGDLSLISGHVNEGESSFQAACREGQEEILGTEELLNDCSGITVLGQLGNYSFILQDERVGHVVVYEGVVSPKLWFSHGPHAELFSIAEITNWIRQTSKNTIRSTTVIPGLVLKYGLTPAIQELIEVGQLSVPVVIHGPQPIFLEPAMALQHA